MKTASVAEVQSQLNDVLKASASGPVVVTRNGKPVAVIVGVQNEVGIEQLLSACSPRLQAILEKSRRQIRAGEVLGHEEFWAQVKQSRNAKRRPKKRTPTTTG